MSIKKINVKNYKSFKDASINLKPVSILIGSNSSGKSSLIKLILLLSQSLDIRGNTNDVAFKSLGKFVDMGEEDNIYFNKNTANKIEIELEFEQSINFDRQLHSFKRRLLSSLKTLVRINIDCIKSIHLVDDKITTKFINSYRQNAREYKTDYSLESFMSYINLFKKSLKILNNLLEEANKKSLDLDEIDYEGYDIHSSIKRVNDIDISDYISIVHSLTKFDDEIRITKIAYELKFNKNKTKTTIDSISLLNKNKNIIKVNNYTANNRKSITISSDYIETKQLNKQKSKIQKYCTYYGLLMVWKSERGRYLIQSEKSMRLSPTSYFLYHIFNTPMKVLSNSFNQRNIRYVSPLRAYPKRYYQLSREELYHSWDTSNGDNLATVLETNPEIKKSLNKWLKYFDLSIDTKKLNHLFHSIIVNHNNINLDLTDVGFGISQIIPVLIQPILSDNDGIILIEQPEIHIHPKAQSILADFFIDVVLSSNKKIIIETHSEYLLKRLRRRMAENTKELEGSINANNVAIHYVNKRNNVENSAKVEIVDISTTGNFNWPVDFIDNDIDDMVNFMKYQN